MNRVIVLGETNTENMGPSCLFLKIKIPLKDEYYNLLFDCGMAIKKREKKNLPEFAEPDPNLPEKIKIAIKEMLKKEMEEMEEEKTEYELIPPDFSLIKDEKIDALLTSHGHFDHIGSIMLLETGLKKGNEIVFPKLFKDNGKIFGSHYTLKLIDIHLNDMLNRKQNSEFGLFDIYDLEERYKEIPLGQTEILPGIKITAVHAGHIHGATSFILHTENDNALLMTDTCFHDTVLLKKADMLSTILPKHLLPDRVLNTDLTYGEENGKNYENEFNKLKNQVIKTVLSGGKVLIPSFMIERGQNAIIGLVDELKKHGIPIYADGGTRKVFDVLQASDWSDKEIAFTMDNVKFVQDYDKKTNYDHRNELLESNKPMVIVAPSGSAELGIVGEKYLAPFLEDKKNAVIFIGHLPKGSAGQRLIRAKHNKEKMFFFKNQTLELNCEVYDFKLSAHSSIRRSCEYFEDIVYAREKKMKYCLLMHGEKRNKEAAKKLFSPYFDKIEFGYTGKIIEF